MPRSILLGAYVASSRLRPEITAPKRDGKPGGRPGEEDEGDDADALLTQAVDIVRRSDKASASLLQRRLSIGYGRAARIVDQLQEAGVLGPSEGAKGREVLMGLDELDAMFGGRR